jgi:hypothetical protein
MSKDLIKKFLQDAKAHPDTTVITIGDQQTTLGDLRAMDTEERQDLSARLADVETRRKEVEKRQGEVVDLAQKAQAAYNAAEEARLKAGAARVDPSTDPWKDPWLAPVKDAIDARDKKIGELQEMLKTTVGAVSRAAQIFSEDRYDREYGSLNFGKREKKPTRDELLKMATDEKLLDRHGIPSITKAWDKFSEADRMEELRKEAFERGREAAHQESMAARIPPPGVPGPGMSGPSPKITPQTDVLGDLYAEAAKDPELRELMAQLPAGLVQ